jgi:enoyl-CoA hydratase
MNEASRIVYEERGAWAIVRISRAEKRNSLTRAMLDELLATFKRIERERVLRAVILTGYGAQAFSAGTDINELTTLDVETARETAQRGQAVCDEIERCGVPVIAAINGLAAGGGLELALACHLRVASDNATFSLPEIKLGVIPAYGGTQRLARIIGTGRAFELMLMGASLTAEEAQRIGLLNRITTLGQLLAQSESLAQEISHLAPLAIRSCLEAVTRGLSLPLNEGLALEAKLFSKLFATEDMREGTRAFLEKRAPVFKGR